MHWILTNIKRSGKAMALFEANNLILFLSYVFGGQRDEL